MSGWRFDKSFSLPNAAMFLTTIFSVVWYMATQGSRIDTMELKVKKQESEIALLMTQSSDVRVQLAGIQAGQQFVIESLKEIKQTMNQHKGQ